MGKQKSKEGPISNLVSTIIAAPFAAIVFSVMVVTTVIFRPFRRRLTDLLQLRQLSRYYKWFKWITTPIGIAGGIGFLLGVFGMYEAGKEIYVGTVENSDIFKFGYALMISVTASFVVGIIMTISEFHNDVALQQSFAGSDAEQFVRKLLLKKQKNIPGSNSLHGSLMVFNRGQENEFSLETDHLLITERSIYVIETKYKSGTISADRDAGEWEVSHDGNRTKMRNALKQAQNAAKVLRRQFGLNCDVIPVVAVKGNPVTIVNAPFNVTQAENVWNVISQFEAHGSGKDKIDVAATVARLQQAISTDAQDRQNHIKRARAAMEKGEVEKAVDFLAA